MKVAIVGAWHRTEADDFQLVNDLITALARQYPTLWVHTFGCDRGVGKIVSNRCMPERGEEPMFRFTEVAMHVFAKNATPAEMAAEWEARNAALYESSEEFHIFMDISSNLGGQMHNLLKRVREGGRPCSVYNKGDKVPKLIRL